ncbi:MAG TPA: BREX system ATP-binding domain-containing protein [Capsulimonadaceae bacterium]
MTHAEPTTMADKWLGVIGDEYLSEFLRSGGAAVKVIAGADDVLADVTESIRDAATTGGYYYALVDPSKLTATGKSPALHRIDRFFFEATKDFDWTRWAHEQARHYLETAGITVPAGCGIRDIEQIAEANGRDAQDLINQYQREFATPQLRDVRLSIEFRAAITALGRAQLIPDALSPTTEEVLLEWLRGRAVPGGASALKKVQIYERINAANARTLFASFCRWLPHAGHGGLVVVLDFRPYEFKRTPKGKKLAEENERLRNAILAGKSPDELATILAQTVPDPDVVYSDAAYMQMLTMLRRFIDEIDTLDNMLLVVLTTPNFYKDKTLDATVKRCYFDYDALQTRIGQEVHDEHRANLAASLVHLGGAR